MLPTDRLPVTIDGTTQPLLLHWMRGHEELGRMFEYELELYSEKLDVAFDTILGKPLTVCMKKGGGTRFFNGIVTRLRRVGTEGRYLVFRAILSPRLWLLQKTTDCRIYQKKSVLDVVKEVLREHAITFSERLQAGSYPKWDYLTQYRESDFAFISRIMEREGIYYYFKHTQSAHDMVLSDSVSSHDPVDGYNPIPVRPPGTAGVDRDHFTGWRIAHEITSIGATWQAHDFRLNRGADIKAVVGVPAEHEQDDFQLYDYAGHYMGAQEDPAGAVGEIRTAGEHYARVQLDERRTDLERIEGEGNLRGLEVGALFQFDDLNAPTDKFLVTVTEHEVRNPQFQSSAQAGGGTDDDVCQMSFWSINSKRQFRPARITEKPLVHGPESAIVVGQPGEEITTDKYGRVRIQFHWDREGKSNEASTCWVRVSQIWAGPSWGAIYIPRIGHEVIVQFLGGDPDRPIIMGSVYNASNMPPYTLPDNKTQSGIKSRSTKGAGPGNFNELRFEDKKGSEQVYLQAEKNQDNLVKADATLTVGANRVKTIGIDETVDVGSNRTETVGQNESETIGVNQTITVGADRSKTVGANETVNIGINQTAGIGANQTVTIGANQVVNVGANASETVGVNKSITVGVAMQLSVGAAMNVSVGGVLGEEVGVSKSVNVTGASSEDVGGNKSVTSGGNITEGAKGNVALSAGKKGSFSAGDELTLTCGAATIVLKKSGDITIKGKKIVVEASSDLILKGSKIKQN